MSVIPTSLAGAQYRCPICQLSLNKQDNLWQCCNKHSFDIAKEGYVNLLPVQFKHSKNPGDSKVMVQARRHFLNLGYYQPLADKIVALYKEYSAQSINVLDAGCGEGFYTKHLALNNNAIYGVDIAKEAIKLAAKQNKANYYSVGSVFQLPFVDNFFSWILSVYAPISQDEIQRVLADDGFILTVTPGENHLLALKQHLYQNANLHDVDGQQLSKFTLLHEERLSYPMEFNNNEDVQKLLAMTPFLYKTTTEINKKLASYKHFSCEADFVIRLYKNNK
jgi:23S rRNA (guanine745-N1)-methyltransferase